MAGVTVRVIKGSDVEIKGKFKLELIPVGQASAKDSGRPLVTPQVRVVEKNPEFAVIEVTCSCGTKALLRCEYASAQSSGGSAEVQNDASGS
jgi:hypothetical protein